MDLPSDDLHTLQLGPLWLLSALAGRHTNFASYELNAFWDTVAGVTLRTPGLAREILTSMTRDRAGLLLDFELDDRPVVSGLRHIVAILERMDPTTGEDYKLALLRIGTGFGRARGPYGQKITHEDVQLLLLLAELLEIEAVPPIADDILV